VGTATVDQARDTWPAAGVAVVIVGALRVAVVNVVPALPVELKNPDATAAVIRAITTPENTKRHRARCFPRSPERRRWIMSRPRR
jgi:hypothetical protein